MPRPNAWATTKIYARLIAALENKQPGSRVYQMKAVHGAMETQFNRPTDGLLKLAGLDRLDLAAERLALDPRYAVVGDIRAAARRNLEAIGASDETTLMEAGTYPLFD